MTDRTRVGGSSGATPSTVGDKSAEDGFQKALGQRLSVPTVGEAPAKAKPQPRGPAPSAPQPRKPQGPAPTPARPGPPTATSARAPDRAVSDRAVSDRAVPRVEARDNTDRGGRFSGLGDRLVDLRKTLGVTQVELARRMGSTQPAMARIEKGDMKPNLRTLARYGEAIGQRVEVALQPLSPDAEAAIGLERVAIDAVPDALAQVRRQLGLTQAQVATAMETSQPVIARLENGEAVPNLRTLERYCEALGVEPVISFLAIEAAADSDDADEPAA